MEVLEWQIAEETKDPATYPEQERKALGELLAKLREADEPLPPAEWPISK